MTHCFAIDRDQLRGEFTIETLHKGDEASIESLGINRTEDASEGVIARNTVRKFEESLEPRFFVLGETFHVVEALALADDRG